MLLNIMECFIGFISGLFTEEEEPSFKNYWNVTYNIPPKYVKSEEFINDGRELYMVAQMIERPEILPSGVMDYVEDKICVADISYNKVLRALFEKHANIYNIPLKDAIEKWISKYDTIFGKSAKPIHDVLLEVEWEWLEPEMDRS